MEVLVGNGYAGLAKVGLTADARAGELSFRFLRAAALTLTQEGHFKDASCSAVIFEVFSALTFKQLKQ